MGKVVVVFDGEEQVRLDFGPEPSPALTREQMEVMLNLKPQSRRRDQIDDIMRQLSPSELEELRQQLNKRFDQALLWFDRLLH